MSTISIGFIAPTHPYVIRFEDARCIGGYKDLDYLTEADAVRRFKDIQRKRSKTNAVLYVAGKGVAGQGIAAWWGKGGKVVWL